MMHPKIAEAFALAGVVALLDLQIERLNQARELLTQPLNGTSTTQKKPARRTLSASGRKSIADAQRKRWAEQKRKARARKKKVTPPA